MCRQSLTTTSRKEEEEKNAAAGALGVGKVTPYAMVMSKV
jgi:hypothetical protein